MTTNDSQNSETSKRFKPNSYSVATLSCIGYHIHKMSEILYEDRRNLSTEDYEELDRLSDLYYAKITEVEHRYLEALNGKSN